MLHAVRLHRRQLSLVRLDRLSEALVDALLVLDELCDALVDALLVLDELRGERVEVFGQLVRFN